MPPKSARLELSQAQHRALADLLAKAHMIHSQAGNGLGVPAGMLEDVPIYVRAGQGGRGWWSSLGSALKTGVKELQKSSVVRDAEKGLVNYGAKAVRTAAEGALDGLGDYIAPEFAPMIDGAVDRGLSSLQKRAVSAADSAIDASGRGHCPHCHGGHGGMALSGTRITHGGNGMRLSQRPQYGGAMALAGDIM